MDEDTVIRDGTSLEIGEHMVMEETVNCCTDVDMADKDVQHHESNGEINGNIHDSCLVTMTPLEENPHMSANDISTETIASDLLETSDEPCSRNVTLDVDGHGIPLGVSNDESSVSKSSCDMNVLAKNLKREQHNETEEFCSNVDEYNMGSSEENIGKGQRVLTSDDSLGRRCPPRVGCTNQAVASDADATLNQSSAASEAVGCCMDFEMSDKEVKIEKSNEDTNVKGHDPHAVSTTPLEENQNPYTAANDILLCVVSSEIGAGIPLEISGNPSSEDVTPHVSVANDMSIVSRSLNELDMSIESEKHNEAEELSSSVDKNKMGSAEENVGKGKRESSHVDCGVLNAATAQSQSGTVNITADGALVQSTRKKLLVLDVNGLLADISSYVPYFPEPDAILCKKAVFKRPYCNDFLNFCFERFNVGLWSSRTRRNMEPIVDFLLGNAKSKVLFHWDQSHCTYTGFNTVEKSHKPLLVKKLKKLWDKFERSLPWEKGDYNESNTLLIDDSPYKALCNPGYTAIFPYTYRFRNAGDNSLGPGGDLRMYLERLAMAENVQEFVKENPFGQRAITEKNLSWGYYSKVIAAANTSPPRENMFDQCHNTEKNRAWEYSSRLNAAANSYSPRQYAPRQNAEASSNPWGHHSRLNAAANSYTPRQNAPRHNTEASSNPWGYHSRFTASANSYTPRQNAAVSSNQWGYHSRFSAAPNSYPPRQNDEPPSNPWGVVRFWS